MSDERKAAGFTPINNPFIVGNPVRHSSMFYGREAEFELVRRRFTGTEEGGLLIFCGERRSGKTSILFQIRDGRLGADFIPVLIDMQSMAIDNEVDLLSKIAEEVQSVLREEGKAVAPPDFKSGAQPAAAFHKFIERVVKLYPSKKPILLFDEYELFENKIDSGILSPDVLHILSHLMETYCVYLIFTGSQHLENRKRDYWRILGRSLHRQISFLQHDDAVRLMREPVRGQVHYRDGCDEKIFRLAAGQPFYTQAVCQSLVDHLNEAETHDATPEMLETVVRDIIDNPFPQMVFLWETLARDEKLALALLAEVLDDDASFASNEQLMKHKSKRKYPLQLEGAALATALENLFKADLLLKDHATPSGYAFRMDLWRRWIRRAHSVWQVMRELGLEIRAPRRNWARRLPIVALAGVAAVLALILLQRDPAPPARVSDGKGRVMAAAVPMAYLSLETNADAEIYLDERRVAIGAFHDSIQAGVEHALRIAAENHAETTLALLPDAGSVAAYAIELRPLRGDLRVETDPPGAEIRVDGERLAARSPTQLTALSAAREHVVTVTRAGYRPAQRLVRVWPDSLRVVRMHLSPASTDVVVFSEPAGAHVFVNGAAKGTTPLTLPEVALRENRFRLELADHLPADTTLVVTDATTSLQMRLRPEPPSFLVIQGDYPAAMYIDGKLIVQNVQNSGVRQLRAGEHRIRVVMLGGESVDSSVRIDPGEKLTYDYTKREVVQRTPYNGR